MSKKWTCTEKWDDPWFQSLSGNTKLVAMYIWDRCDAAGFWQCNFASAEFAIRPELPIDWNKVFREMNTQPSEELVGLDGVVESDFKKVHRVDNYWWFPSYIPFQYWKPGSALVDSGDKAGSYFAPMFRSLRKHGMLETFQRLYPNIQITRLGPAEPQTPSEFAPPKDIEEVRAYAKEKTPTVTADRLDYFWRYYSALKWRFKGQPARWQELLEMWAIQGELKQKESAAPPESGSSKLWRWQQQIEKLKAAIEEQKRNTFRPPGTFKDIITPAAKKAIREMEERIAGLEKEICDLPKE